ncbi:unnamed protein product, partial [marine sediment metagenome]
FETSANAGSLSISVIDENNQFCNAVSIEDGVSATNTQSVSDNKAINIDNDAGGDEFDATFTSFDTSGWTFNFTNVNATTRKWIGFAVGEEDFIPPVTGTSDGINVSACLNGEYVNIVMIEGNGNTEYVTYVDSSDVVRMTKVVWERGQDTLYIASGAIIL